MNRRIAMLGLLSSVVAAGCAHWTEVRFEPWGLEGAVPFRSESSAPLILEEIQVIENGDPREVSPSFEERFGRAMGREGLFGSFYGPASIENAPAGSARARLRVVTQRRSQPLGTAVAKGALIGLSLFTLAPVLPLCVDKTELMHLEVDLPGDLQTVFEVETSASACVELYGDLRKAWAELDEVVADKNLEALVSRLGSDPEIRAYLYGGEAG